LSGGRARAIRRRSFIEGWSAWLAAACLARCGGATNQGEADATPTDRSTAPTASATARLAPTSTATPAPGPSPTRTITRAPTATATAEPRAPSVTLTIVYDNNPGPAGYTADWGFGCVAQGDGWSVLFDTGASGSVLLGNMRTAGIDPGSIDGVALSHIHSDHVGGLRDLLTVSTPDAVYVPSSFPRSFKDGVRAHTSVVDVDEPARVLPRKAHGLWSTGEVDGATAEQGLVIEAASGAVLLVGCAHPGIVRMVERARAVTELDLQLVMGGFHLGGVAAGELERVAAALRDLGVRRVAPCHCSGDAARRVFADAFGADCVLPHVGFVVNV